MKKILTFLSFAALFSCFISCEIGLGEEVDLEAPEMTVDKMVATDESGVESDPVTSFGTTVYTKKHVIFSGTATDNSDDFTVSCSIKWLGDSDYSFMKKADRSGNSWSVEIEFPKEGACWLKFLAEDKKKNYGIKSSKVAVLFVDETAPVGEGWYIDRLVNGLQCSLKSLDELKSIIEADPELTNVSNIDTAQNGEFLICATFNDAAGIASGKTTIKLYDEEGEAVTSAISQDSGSTSNYAPKFRINGTNIGLPESGKHYYQIRYSSEDIVSDPAPNSVEDAEVEMGWFLWWPESDMPKCSVTNMDEDRTMSVRTGDSLSITVFDDDALSGIVECVLTGNETVSKTITISGTSERQVNVILKVPSVPQSMTLTVSALDMNGNTLSESYTVNVTDEFRPNLIFTSPENNQIPSVSGDKSDITFSGIVLDKAECKFLEVIWVPDSVTEETSEKKALAKKWFDSIDYNDVSAPGSAAVLVNGTGDYALCRKWSVKLTKGSKTGDFTQYSFSFTIPLLDETGFKSEAKNEKYLYARTGRSNAIYADSELKLSGDSQSPEIMAVEPAGNMAIIDIDNDLVMTFKGSKSSGLPMNTDKYAIFYVDPDGNETEMSGSYNTSSGYYVSETVSSEDLKAFNESKENPCYRYYVEDVLGNKNTQKFQFIISSLPWIQTVTSTSSSKCAAGTDIYINVAFSKPVKCSETKGDVQLKLTNIKNTGLGISASDIVYADYSSGSGSTTLVFKYTVQEGDTSDELQVYNEETSGPIKGISTKTAHVEHDYLTTGNNLQEKRADDPIVIDGVVPVISSVAISSDAESGNKNSGISYLKAGRTVTAKVTTDKAVSVQGSPSFQLQTSVSGVNKKLSLNWESISGDGKTITFSKKIAESDVNGSYSYSNAECINNIDVIRDSFGNSLKTASESGTTDCGMTIDTVKPDTPVFYNGKASLNKLLVSGNYNSDVYFSLSTSDSSDKLEYFDYNGKVVSEWTEFTSGTVKVSNDAVLAARATDYAGNVSSYSDLVNLVFCNVFPTYTVECTDSNGYYRFDNDSDYDLTFKVSFSREVNIPASTSAYIELSAGTGTAPVNPKALISSDSKGETSVTSAIFTYKVSKTDEFTVKVAKDAVHLTGFYDMFGNVWSSESDSLSADYANVDIKCDAVPPVVTLMTPYGTEASQNGLKSYTLYNSTKKKPEIKLTFSEPVSAVSGKIYLRQTSDWAIPPMLSASQFNTVLNAVKSASIDTSETYGLTGSQVLYMDGKEDAESLYGSTTGPANDRYHGTAQYMGPYKKMTNGVDSDGNPDLSVKYVLDFSMDIRDTSKDMLTKYTGNYGYTDGSVTEPRFGQTYESHDDSNVLKYHHLYRAGLVKVLTPENKITTDSIRYVLEQAHYHERYMAVNSSYVSVSGNTVTLDFPDGLLGDSELPKGREWELVIEKGAFMDKAGNMFGYDYIASTDSSTNKTRYDLGCAYSDSIQKADGTALVSSDDWGNYRSSVDEDDQVQPVVLIQKGNNACFMSPGVEKPVIRVDRYSYGLGIKQPVSVDSDGIITYSMIDSIGNGATPDLQTGSTAPTAYVGVRIDTESKGAKIRYSTNKVEQTTTSKSNDKGSSSAKATVNYYSVTEQTLPSDPTGEGSENVIFLGGTGSYLSSCKEYIKAQGISGSLYSDISTEGIFQTVLDISQPDHNLSSDRSKTKNTIYNAGDGRQTVNIHGTTGLSGEPTISPFPLRDQALASAYMRQTYQDGDQYYWISYEVLVDAGFSMYVFGQYGWSGTTEYNVSGYKCGWGDWSKNYGLMTVGEFNKCTGLESWTGLSTYTSDSSIVPDNKSYCE